MSWNPEQLIASLLPFQWQNPIELKELQDYCQHYQLPTSPEYDHFIGWTEFLGFRIANQYWRQKSESKGTVWINHGYYDHLGIYQHIIKFWLELGFDVYGFDLPGHGLSSGERASIDSFDQYDEVFVYHLAILQKLQRGPTYWVGQSTGGAIIINYLMTHGVTAANRPFERVILLAPLVKPYNWWVGKMTFRLLRPFVKTRARAFSQNSGDEGFINFLKHHDPLQPLALKVEWVSALSQWIDKIHKLDGANIPISVVQGTLDKTVDGPYNVKFLQRKFNDIDVYWLADGRHHLVNESETLRQKMFAWILKQIQ